MPALNYKSLLLLFLPFLLSFLSSPPYARSCAFAYIITPLEDNAQTRVLVHTSYTQVEMYVHKFYEYVRTSRYENTSYRVAAVQNWYGLHHTRPANMHQIVREREKIVLPNLKWLANSHER